MAIVQVFGVNKSPATRAAERFFKERRVEIQLVDLKKKPMAAGEIGRFIQKFGWAGLLDSDGKSYSDAGLKYLRVAEAEMMGKIEKEPLLLKLPLVRAGKLLSVGQNEAAWKAMIEGAQE